VTYKIREKANYDSTAMDFQSIAIDYPQLGLRDKEMYYEWALLDTHDGTTDFYKHHRSVKKIKKLSGRTPGFGDYCTESRKK